MACSIRTEALCLWLLLAGVAFAAPPSPEARARALATEAKKAFDLNHFEQAIAGYEEAYRLKPAPGLLFNLGQGHRRAGHLEKALFYFRRYLETNPAPAQAKATEEVLAEVQAELDAQRLDQARTQTEQARREEEARSRAHELELEQARLARAREEKEAADKKLALERSLQQQPPPPPKLYQRPLFWVVVGAVAAGTAATITGVALAPQPTTTTFADIDAR
jgi:tetratricopeptide (TPR) repeat protein